MYFLHSTIIFNIRWRFNKLDNNCSSVKHTMVMVTEYYIWYKITYQNVVVNSMGFTSTMTSMAANKHLSIHLNKIGLQIYYR